MSFGIRLKNLGRKVDNDGHCSHLSPSDFVVIMCNTNLGFTYILTERERVDQSDSLAAVGIDNRCSECSVYFSFH